MEPNPNDPDWIVELKERSAKMIVGKASPTVDNICSLLTKYDQMYNKIERLREQLQGAEAELKAQTYHGNSVGYIYDKMLCYKDQVGTMGEIMRTLGQPFESLGNDNIERRRIGLRWAEQVAERIEAAEVGRIRSENRD